MNIKITVLLVTCFAIFASICIKADSVSMEPPFKFHRYDNGFFGILPTWRSHDIDGKASECFSSYSCNVGIL